MRIDNLPCESMILPACYVPRNLTQHHNEEHEDAATVLASLGIQNIGTVASSFRLQPSTTDNGSNLVLPTIVHAPRRNNMTVDHTYRDFSVIDETVLASIEKDEGCNEKDQKVKNSLTRLLGPFTTRHVGGVVKPFPEKLMALLARPDMESIIAWKPHGRAFVVLSPAELEKKLPSLFKQNLMTSFIRQLNLWNFKRLNRKGDDYKCYYHELFLRGRPELAKIMRRHKLKGVGTKRKPNPENEPNFYKMSPLNSSDPKITAQDQNLSIGNSVRNQQGRVRAELRPEGLMPGRTETADLISAMTDSELIHAIQYQHNLNLSQPPTPPSLQLAHYQQEIQQHIFKSRVLPSINMHELQMMQQLPNDSLWSLLSNQQQQISHDSNLPPVQQNFLLSSLFQPDQIQIAQRSHDINAILMLLGTNGIGM